MKKIFEKCETLFCILLIIFYILSNMICIQYFGLEDYRTAIINTIFSVLLIIIIIKLDRVTYYGLTKVKNIKKYFYFIPLLLIVSVNLWGGINLNNSISDITFHILTMINIGFIEEIIFRGFLFKMMEKDNLKSAIIVTSITFGIGHIINLLNGAELIPTIMQVGYSISIGYLFVIIFYKSKSIIPCIITHSIMNSLSIFHIEKYFYIESIFLIIVPIMYAIYINKK